MNLGKTLVVAILAGGALAGCDNDKRRSDPPPAQTKTPVTKDAAGVPKSQTGPAPVGASQPPATGAAPSTSGQ